MKFDTIKNQSYVATVVRIEEGYQLASETRGATALRLPWVKKGQDAKAEAA